VLHAVQGLLHRPVDLKAWPNDDRRNRVVLIGRDVEEQILAGALACLSAIARAPIPKFAIYCGNL
jgi:G3E family GTPase